MLNVKVTLFIVLLLSLRLIIHGITLMKVLNSLYVSFYLFSFSFVLFFRFHCPLSCTDHWSFLNARWDYQVTGPSDERVRDFDRRSTATFEFVLTMLTTISMPKTVRTKQSSFLSSFAHWWFLWISAEHINPILDQIAKLEEALYDIHFQQHWFDAQTERQSIGNNFTLISANPDKIWKHSLINGFNLTGKVNKTMSRRAIYKAMLGSFFLITASFLQIHLLKRLFDRKQGLSRA